MLALHGRKLLLVGLLTTALSASASAADAVAQTAPGDAVTTQQTTVGEAATEVAMLQPPPAVAQQSYATEATARPVSPVPTNRPRSTPARSDTSRDSYKPAPRYVAAAPRGGCAHLGCRGVHVLGIGY